MLVSFRVWLKASLLTCTLGVAPVGTPFNVMTSVPVSGAVSLQISVMGTVLLPALLVRLITPLSVVTASAHCAPTSRVAFWLGVRVPLGLIRLTKSLSLVAL